MFAPDTNPDVQADRHCGPLTGIMSAAVAVLVAPGMLILWLAGSDDAETPEDPQFLSPPGASLPQDEALYSDPGRHSSGPCPAAHFSGSNAICG